MPKTYRVAVIGATGRGDYGHGLDTAFLDLPQAKIVAIADADKRGLQAAGKKLGVDRLYADYHEMLGQQKPDIVCVAPRWVADRVAMVTAAAEAGCHVYCEKPMAFSLPEADAMLRACQRFGVKLALAHQWRAMPPVQQAIRDVRAGKYGKLLRVHARPKDDRRGGGEDMIVHGAHLFDMLIALAGAPRWVAGHVQTQGRDAVVDDRREGTEPVGPILGDSISASFGFADGVRGYFDSTANLSPGAGGAFDNLYGMYLECERAALQFRQPGDVYVYPAPLVLADHPKLAWQKQWIEDWHFDREHRPRPIRKLWLALGNKTLAKNLIDAVERDRPPLSSGHNGRLIVEMTQGIYASHLAAGKRLTIPLEQREHPLA